MYRKYAVVEFVQSLDEVPVKYKLLRKCGHNMLWWYIKKYNPFTMEKIILAGEEGYMVKLPFTVKDVLTDQESGNQLINNTLETLKDFRVSLLLPPRDYPYMFPSSIRIATGQKLSPIFAKQAVERMLRYIGKELKDAEILIIGDNDDLTNSMIDFIYPHVNYLSVIVNTPEMVSAFKEKAAEIFADVGLNLNVSIKSKSILESADCIINTGAAEQYDYYYKRGAAYLDLSGHEEGFKELLGKRDDLVAVNSLRVKYADQIMNIDVFELAFFLKSSNYRSLLYRGYQNDIAKQILNEINHMDIRFGGFCRLGNVYKKEGI